MSNVFPEPEKNTPDAASDDAVAAEGEQTPVFSEVAAEHPEVDTTGEDDVLAASEPDAQPFSEETTTPDESSSLDESASIDETAHYDEPTPLVEPAAREDERDVESATAAAPIVHDTSGADLTEPDSEQAHAAAEHTAAAEPAAEQAAPASAPAVGNLEAELATPTPSYEPVAVAPASPQQTVYVQAPTPPKKKGNRGIGVLLAFVGTIIFALLYSLATAIAYISAGRDFDVANFAMSTAFLVPTAVFLVVFILTVMFLNRAGWWAWVLSSLIVAVAVYFASIGVILLLGNVVAMTPLEANLAFTALAMSAPLIIAAVLAREVSMWMGAAIAARGRKVKARNAEAAATYERDLAENRRQYA